MCGACRSNRTANRSGSRQELSMTAASSAAADLMLDLGSCPCPGSHLTQNSHEALLLEERAGSWAPEQPHGSQADQPDQRGAENFHIAIFTGQLQLPQAEPHP